MYPHAETDSMAGTLFDGRYLINHLVARGGMGNIYQANDIKAGIKTKRKLGKAIANKVEHAKWPEIARKQGQTLRANDNCVMCGTCAKVCPTGNIRFDLEKRVQEPAETFCFASARIRFARCLQPRNSRSQAVTKIPNRIGSTPSALPACSAPPAASRLIPL